MFSQAMKDRSVSTISQTKNEKMDSTTELKQESNDENNKTDNNSNEGYCKFDGKAMSARNKINICDMRGEILCVLKKKLIATSNFKLWNKDETQEIAIVKKRSALVFEI